MYQIILKCSLLFFTFISCFMNTTTTCFLDLLSRSNQVSWYHKKHSLTPWGLCRYYTTSLINFLHLLRFIASSVHIFGSDNFFLRHHTNYLWLASRSCKKTSGESNKATLLPLLKILGSNIKGHAKSTNIRST